MTVRSQQTVHIQIKLLINLGIHCLPFLLRSLYILLYEKKNVQIVAELHDRKKLFRFWGIFTVSSIVLTSQVMGIGIKGIDDM